MLIWVGEFWKLRLFVVVVTGYNVLMYIMYIEHEPATQWGIDWIDKEDLDNIDKSTPLPPNTHTHYPVASQMHVTWVILK